MKRVWLSAALFSIVLGVVLAGAASAARFNKKVEIGQQAPSFEDLEGVDGKQHGLGDYEDAKIVVLAFTGNECPVAQAYEQRFKQLQEEYGEKGVVFVAINCNTEKYDNLEAMKKHAAERDFNFDYLSDPSQESGKAFGATVTPHLFVLDQDRKIAYMGAFDDNMLLGEVKHHYLVDAVNALLAGKDPEVTETRQKGCGIQYR